MTPILTFDGLSKWHDTRIRLNMKILKNSSKNDFNPFFIWQVSVGSKISKSAIHLKKLSEYCLWELKAARKGVVLYFLGKIPTTFESLAFVFFEITFWIKTKDVQNRKQKNNHSNFVTEKNVRHTHSKQPLNVMLSSCAK